MSFERRDHRVSGIIQTVHPIGKPHEEGVTTNFSSQGLFYSTTQQWAMGQLVPLVVDSHLGKLFIKGRVVHKQVDGVGFEFVDLTDQDQKSIRTVVIDLLNRGAWFDERRKRGRVRVRTSVVWMQNRMESSATIIDINASGCLIESVQAPAMGSSIMMYVTQVGETDLSAQDVNILGCRANVTHLREGCFGVEFESPSLEFMQMVGTRIDAGDPADIPPAE